MERLAGRRRVARGLLVTALAFLVLLAALWVGLSQVGARSGREQAEALEGAVRRAAMLCYAVEGRYPSGAQELCDHYGLSYNQDRYIVSITSFASNLLPDIRVLTVGGGERD